MLSVDVGGSCDDDDDDDDTCGFELPLVVVTTYSKQQRSLLIALGGLFVSLAVVQL